VTGDRFRRSEVRKKRLGGPEEIIMNGLSGGRRRWLMHRRQYRVGFR
jgi:hypothetical protein